MHCFVLVFLHNELGSCCWFIVALWIIIWIFTWAIFLSLDIVIFLLCSCIHSIRLISGISYLSRAQEAEALQNLCSAYDDDSSNSSSEDCMEIPIVSTADLLFTQRMKTRFQEWRDGILRHLNEACPLEGNPDDTKMQLQTVLFKMRPAVLLKGFSSHQVKLIKLVMKFIVYFHSGIYILLCDMLFD